MKIKILPHCCKNYSQNIVLAQHNLLVRKLVVEKQLFSQHLPDIHMQTLHLLSNLRV